MTGLELLKNQIEALNTTEFLVLVEEECAKRKVARDNVKGGNDIEINKIYMLLTDQFWMREIFVVLYNGMYQGFKLTELEAKEAVIHFSRYCFPNNATYKREIVDLRDIY